MNRTIDYYLSLISPFAYLGHERLLEIARRHGAEVNIYPVKLGEVFAETGGLPLPKRSPQRRAYRLLELRRWSRHLDIPLNPEPAHFPADERLADGMVIAARERGEKPLELAGAILRAVWAEQRDIAERDTLLGIARRTGVDGEALLEAAAGDGCAATLEADTRRAIERGVFGSPTYICDDELFWGQDRLELLERKLAG